jgi:flagellar hook-basal body complex protein FliE
MAPLPITGVPGMGAASPLQPLQPLQDIAGADAAGAAPTVGGSSFQSFLTSKLGSVAELQQQADAASQAVASGQSSDLAGATVAVEKASIAMELTGAIRNKVIDAYQEIMRMQV